MLNNFTKKIKNSDYFLFSFLLVFRLINALLIKTIFEPDEIWQSIEIVSDIVTGRGYITWDVMLGIRSINFAMIYLIPAYIASLFHSMYIFYVTPKIINGILAALTDYFTIKCGYLYSVDALLTTCLSHGLFLYSPRSHINSFEMLLGISCFYFLQRFIRMNYKKERIDWFFLRCFIHLMIFGTYLRPSLCVLNLIPFLITIYKLKLYLKLFRFVPEIILNLSILILNDSIFYKEFVIPPINFVKLNLLYDISSLFGVQAWYSHVFFAFILLGFSFFTFFYCLKKHTAKYLELFSVVILYVFFYSSLGHKEMRFLLPIIPFCLIISAPYCRKYLIIYLLTFFIGIFIGYSWQNVDSTISCLFKEINQTQGKVTILSCLTPYIIPHYPFSIEERVKIDRLSGNCNLYEKIKQPKIYKRYNNKDLVIEEHKEFLKDMKVNIYKIMHYNYLLFHEDCYEEVKDILSQKYSILSIESYKPMKYDERNKIIILKMK